MNFLKHLFLLAFVAVASVALGQERFTSCAAAFIDGKMVVDEYSPTGKCVIAAQTTGELTVQTADLSPERSIPTGKVAFKIAIRDGNSKTLLSFSNETYKQVDIRSVLAKCQPGDSIVILTSDDKYALPHHEILIR